MSEHYIYGVHAVFALLDNPLRRIKLLYVSETREDPKIQKILERAERENIPISRLSSQAMKQQFGEIVHQGVVASADPLKTYDESDINMLLATITKPALILILDGVTDPHNFGACLRSADAAGVDFVLIPKDNSVSINATVSKVASGAAETIPVVQVTNLARSMSHLKEQGIWLYGAAGEAAQSIYKFNFTGAVGLVLGAEGKGMRRLTREHCDGIFNLPMGGTVSSLNVSVAAGISLYEVVRQRISL